MKNMKTEVSVDFIKQAHKEACDTWKEKIEKEFPDLFKYSELEKLYREFTPSNKATHQFCSSRTTLHSFDKKLNRITVYLPNANTEWTVAAFNWVIEFIEYCEKNSSSNIYPSHRSPNTRKIYIVTS